MAAPVPHSSTFDVSTQAAEQVGQAPNRIARAPWQHLTQTPNGEPVEPLDPCGPNAEKLIQRGLDVIGSGDSLTPAQCAGLASDMTKATMQLIYEGKGLTDQSLLELQYRQLDGKWTPLKLSVWGLSRVIDTLNQTSLVRTRHTIRDIAEEQNTAAAIDDGETHYGYYSPQYENINQFFDSADRCPPNIAQGAIQAELDESMVHMAIKAMTQGESKLPDFTPGGRVQIAAIAGRAPHLFGGIPPSTISRDQYYTAMRTAGRQGMLPEPLKLARAAFSENIAFKQALYTYPEFAAWLLGSPASRTPLSQAPLKVSPPRGLQPPEAWMP